MANPVLSRPDAFTPASYGYSGYQQAYAAQGGAAYGQPAYGQPAYGQPAFGQPVDAPATMTYDLVLNRAALLLGLLFLTAGVAYTIVPPMALYPAALVCGLVAVIFPFLVATRRHAAPGLILAYSAVEGVFIGGISKIFESSYPGIVVQAVLGTIAVAAVVLIAFRGAGFRASARGNQIVRIGLFAFLGVALLNLVLRLFGVNLGLFPAPGEAVSVWAWAAVLIGIGLAVYSLLQDLTFIERGVAMGAGADQSWTAAFGLVVTLVFLYTQVLRVLSYIRR